MIEKLADAQDASRLYANVFGSFDPFEPKPDPSLRIRVVLFPTDGYYLTEKQFGAIASSSSAAQANPLFYISEVEWEHNTFLRGKHYRCIQPSFAEYSNISVGVENAVYSSDGSWGVLISHELHGLMVCDESFWNSFKSYYPDWAEDEVAFTDYWSLQRESELADTEWLKGFLGLLKT